MATTNALVVHSPFAAYTRGQVIKDPAVIAKVLASVDARFVHCTTIAATSEAAAPEPHTPTVEEAVADGVKAAEAALHPAAEAAHS